MNPSRRKSVVTWLVLTLLGALALAHPASAGKKLGQLGDARNLWIGSAASVFMLDWREGGVSTPIRDNAKYRKTLAKEFSAVATGYDLMWAVVHPSRDEFDFSQAEEIVAFAEANNMMVRGHPLVWHQNLPDWLTGGSWSKKELEAILQEHIETVVTHFMGRVHYYDVVNEPIVCSGPDGFCGPDRKTELRDTIWRRIGSNYIEKAFRWAHAADPDARLFLNETWHEGFKDTSDLKAREDATYELVKKLLKKKVPIDGVGFQMHLRHGIDWGQDPASVAANMARYAELGLEVQITEMDVMIEEPATKKDLTDQGKMFRDMMEVCLGALNCTLFQVWGWSDRHSWIPSVFEGFGSATLFDQKYKKKPAYKQLSKALKK